MNDWDDILNKISAKFHKAKQASLKKEVFKEESDKQSSRKRPPEEDEYFSHALKRFKEETK